LSRPSRVHAAGDLIWLRSLSHRLRLRASRHGCACTVGHTGLRVELSTLQCASPIPDD
jgi:hypothetical protein